MSARDPAADLEESATAVRPTDVGALGAAFDLVVVDGANAGARFAIDPADPAPLLVGKGPACTVRLDDAQVSRRHASLDAAGLRVRVRNLGSTNGTTIDDVAVVDAFLGPGETLRVGATSLRLERRAAPLATPPAAGGFGRVVGASPEMRRLYPLVERLARATIPVVIEGETGTGKEVLAEAIHEASPRAAGPYVVFDCTAVPPSLVESELFGHERGAFTGAVAARKGVFEQAHEGTLLIDEIGDLDLALQPKLLRALERSEIRRVGGDRPLRVDVRVLAATRRDLDQEVQAGRFRDDLFHRLAVGRVELPPLRARRGDVPVLARHFWAELGGHGDIGEALLARWEGDPWPGNIRELRNAIARHIAVGDLADEAPAPTSQGGPPRPTPRDAIERVLAERLPLPIARLRIVEELERRYIDEVLAAHGGNVAAAAAASGIGRRYFQMLRSGKRR